MDPNNYRKISCVPALGKIFETIINNRAKYAKRVLNLDDPLQNGFKEGARATDNAFILNSLIDISAERKRPLYVCYVDFKSAFDYVNRSALLYKIFERGIGGKYFQILKSMYNNARSRVKWDGQLGRIFDNLTGVLQGSVVSPTLFKLFLDDLKDYLQKNKGVSVGDIFLCYLLFADDLLLLSETSTGLQHLIRGLEEFCKQWHMLLNLTKTKISVYNERYQSPDAINTFYFNGNIIEKTGSYNYVGVIFSTKSDRFSENYQAKRDKALKAIFAAKKMVHESLGQHMNTKIYFKIFDTQLQPILDYGSDIWYSGKSINILESVHTTFIKRVLGVKIQTSNLAVYGETGRFPIELRQKEMTIKYWCRIVTLDKK